MHKMLHNWHGFDKMATNLHNIYYLHMHHSQILNSLPVNILYDYIESDVLLEPKVLVVVVVVYDTNWCTIKFVIFYLVRCKR